MADHVVGSLKVGLVICAAQKLTHPALALGLHVSQLFTKASAYAARTCDRWYILSSKHGLVHPDTVLEPYDMKLGTKRGQLISPWTDMVLEQLTVKLASIRNPAILALCGEQYRLPVYSGPWMHEAPMRGVGIGQQLGWHTARLADA